MDFSLELIKFRLLLHKDLLVLRYYLYLLLLVICLVIFIGFGLLLIRTSDLAWSSLGFNLLITSISAQTYFLVNAFWTKATIYMSGTTTSFFNAQITKIYLTAA